MDKNKYNIEEVFKSELEDFEMDLPQNLWSNVSNSLNSSSTAAKAGIFGSKLLPIAVVSSTIAIIGGAIILSNLQQNNSQHLSQQVTEEPKLKEVKVTPIKNTPPSQKQIELDHKETTIDPVIEKVNKEEKTTSSHYIINSEEETIATENKTEYNNSSISTENTTINTPKSIAPSKKIEVIEVQSTQTTASISATPIGGYAPLTIAFSHDNEEVKTLWNFNDGSTSSQKDISHTFEKQGTYNIELTTTNDLGESSITTKEITILSTSSISKIPNIFTPNNDNINDLFVVKHENIETFNLYIYSKKGELIYETDDITNGWNGNTQYEEEAKTGDYIYIIKASGIDGKTFEEKGIIKLAR